MQYFRGGLEIDDLAEFRTFDENSQIEIGSCLIEIDDNHDFFITDKEYGLERLKIPGEVTYNVTFDLGRLSDQQFTPPKFGVTCLGPSHGFDPEDNTSGFIIWINNRGIMVDPPVNSTEWLEKSNVNPRFIDNIILTHIHAIMTQGHFKKY